MRNYKIVYGMVLSMASCVLAEDVFPDFNVSPIQIRVPVTTPGSMIDRPALVGTNYVYDLNGQILTNSANGHIQSVKEGFSGTSDKSTPWKSLTEMLAAFQAGCPENKIRSIYSDNSKEFLNLIYGNSAQTVSYKTFGLSVTNMQVLMGHDFQNGFLAYVRLGCTNGAIVTPVYVVKSTGGYLLSSANTTQTNLLNIMAFLNSNSMTNLIH